MNRLETAVVLGGALCLGGCAGSHDDSARRDGAVYEAVVEHARVTFLLGSPIREWLLADSIYALPDDPLFGTAALPPPIGPREKDFGMIPWLLLFRLDRAGTRPWHEAAIPPLGRIVHSSEVDSVFAQDTPSVAIMLSPVVYSLGGNTALVYYGLYCGPTCGHGAWVYLRERAERWQVMEEVTDWIS